MELKIFITYRCNLNCKYCFVIHNHKMTMDKYTLERILDWAIFKDPEQKRIVLTGGEPTSSFDLIAYAFKFVSKNDTKNKIKFDYVPTNGTLLDEEKIGIAKSLNIRFAFSLDGYDFNSNKYRFKDAALYNKTISNIKLYTQATNIVPRIKMTVNPHNAGLFYDNVKSLLRNGLNNIQILPAFGCVWKDGDKKRFLDNFEKILLLHRHLKESGKIFSIDPIDWYLDMIRQSDYKTITNNNCDMGDQVSFDPDGNAFACLGMIHLSNNEALKDKFRIGSIDSRIDLNKMHSFGNYLICPEVDKEKCKYCFPSISCKKICSTIDFKSGKKINGKFIRNLNEIENHMFHRVYSFYRPRL